MTVNVVKKQPEQEAPVVVLLRSMQDQIQKALPKHLTAERVGRIALTEIRKNPKLLACDPYSVIGAIMQSSQLGLEIGSGLGHAYLVPYKAECTLITGYKGQVDLMRRSGKIKGVWAYLIYKEDIFDEGVKNGVPYLTYSAARTGRERKPEEEMIGALAVAQFDDQTTQWVYMEKWEVDKIRDGLRYKSDTWRDHYGEMAKKTAVRRLSKMCPQSPEILQANQIEDGERRSHQPFIDVQVLPENYEPQQQKIGETEAAQPGEHKLSHEKQAEDEVKAVAIGDLSDTVKAFEAAGGKIKDLWSTYDPSNLPSWTLDRIKAANDILKAKMKGMGK